ncbi:MAG: hypothetical protein JWR52_1469 [Marmoricola sp.]|nr:hypothetical protein [Marmoricola sp.]
MTVVTGLGIHPVKSTAIREVQQAEVRPWGLDGDRRWMVVGADNTLVSARELRTLFTVVADTASTCPGLDVPLRLTAPGLDPLVVFEPDSDLVDVRLHSNDLQGRPADPAASAWMRTATGRDDLTLIWCDDPSRRILSPAHSRPGDHTGFADGYPVTLASLDSLAQLNDWMISDALERGEEPPVPLPVQRFRPNVTVQGNAAFSEDDWDGVRIGEVTFLKAKRVDRCVMTTISAEDLTSTKEPIRTLARHRLADQLTWFAIHLIPTGTGEIRVGDAVEAF